MGRKFSANGATVDCSQVKYQYGRPSGGQTVDPSFVGANVQGRLVAVSTGCPYQRGGRIDELYSYNVAGAVLRKRMRITHSMSTVTKDIDYALGNLVRVWEPRPGDGPGFETLYAYTIFGKLSTVTMSMKNSVEIRRQCF
jgi:hypothetical protein